MQKLIDKCLLTETEIDNTYHVALKKNPHWEVDAWGLFGEMSRATIEKAIPIIAEDIKKELEALAQPSSYRAIINLKPEQWQSFWNKYGVK